MDAEERGQGAAIAQNLREMSRLGVPVIVVVIGEGGSGGALALGVGNRIYMLENAVYSVISPESCAAIIYRDSSARAAGRRRVEDDRSGLLGLGLIDGIVPEPGEERIRIPMPPRNRCVSPCAPPWRSWVPRRLSSLLMGVTINSAAWGRFSRSRRPCLRVPDEEEAVLYGILFLVVVLGAIVYSSMNLAKYRVEVCMSFHGQSTCRTASGTTEDWRCTPR